MKWAQQRTFCLLVRRWTQGLEWRLAPYFSVFSSRNFAFPAWTNHLFYAFAHLKSLDHTYHASSCDTLRLTQVRKGIRNDLIIHADYSSIRSLSRVVGDTAGGLKPDMQQMHPPSASTRRSNRFHNTTVELTASSGWLSFSSFNHPKDALTCASKRSAPHDQSYHLIRRMKVIISDQTLTPQIRFNHWGYSPAFSSAMMA